MFSVYNQSKSDKNVTEKNETGNNIKTKYAIFIVLKL